MRLRLFSQLAALRLRLFLHEILQLHTRYLIAFFYIFGLILSGNEQVAMRKAFAHLLTGDAWNQTDLVLMSGLLLYAWIVAAVTRSSARGGRVHYFSEALPLPFSWERAIRLFVLTTVNLTLLLLCGMGWQQLIHEPQAWAFGLLLWASYYIWILGLQLSLLEHNWRFFPFWILGALLLVIGKGTPAAGWLCAGSFALAFWSFLRKETRPHDHPELPLGTWEARMRSAITRRCPPQLMMQLSYVIAKPAVLIYCVLIALGLNTVLYMVLKHPIPDSQRIHVYSSVTGIISLVFSSFFRNFFLQRGAWQTWLNSLPREDAWWLRQDTIFVAGLYALLTVPISLILVLQSHLPALVPLMILPVHGLGFFLLRYMQRSRHQENSILYVIGLCSWFILLGWICDHALQTIG